MSRKLTRIELTQSVENTQKNQAKSPSTLSPKGFLRKKVEAAGIETGAESAATAGKLVLCVECESCGAAHTLHLADAARLSLTESDTQLQQLVHKWASLPDHIRRTIMTLLHAAPPEPEDIPF